MLHVLRITFSASYLNDQSFPERIKERTQALLESQESFNGSFSANCLTAPVNKNMRIFFNTVLQGQSTVFGKKNINDNTNQDARDKIACIISQLLMYNATKGVHHTVKTDTVRHSKERETPFPLYYGLKLLALGRQKN